MGQTSAVSVAGRAKARRSPLPGFGLSLGFSLTYLSLLVLIPLAALFLHAAGLGPSAIWHELTSHRVLHALGLSFGGALVAAAGTAPVIASRCTRGRGFRSVRCD